MSRILGILIIGKIEPIITSFLQDNLLNYLEIFQDVRIMEKVEVVPKEAYNEARDQYRSIHFLHVVKKYLEKEKLFRGLGLTDVDLFVPTLNFVFGVAKDHETVISIHRLYPEFYEQAPDQSLFLNRTLKEAIHELGHTLGLDHCNNKCIMRFSNSILDTDQKPREFCAPCSMRLTSKLE